MLRVINKILWLFETLLIVVISITVFIVVINFFQLNILKRDYVSVFGYSIFEVASNSMSPTINKKDVILVKKNSKIASGDIITFKNQNAFITHRVLSESNKEYMTKGDSNNTEDQPILKDTVIGEVVQIMPKVGVWRDVIKSPQIIITTFIVLVLLSKLVSTTDNKPEKVLKMKRKYRKDFRITKSEIIGSLSK